jgi:hypothetical protein
MPAYRCLFFRYGAENKRVQAGLSNGPAYPSPPMATTHSANNPQNKQFKQGAERAAPDWSYTQPRSMQARFSSQSLPD